MQHKECTVEMLCGLCAGKRKIRKLLGVDRDAEIAEMTEKILNLQDTIEQLEDEKQHMEERNYDQMEQTAEVRKENDLMKERLSLQDKQIAELQHLNEELETTTNMSKEAINTAAQKEADLQQKVQEQASEIMMLRGMVDKEKQHIDYATKLQHPGTFGCAKENEEAAVLNLRKIFNVVGTDQLLNIPAEDILITSSQSQGHGSFGGMNVNTLIMLLFVYCLSLVLCSGVHWCLARLSCCSQSVL